MALAGEWCSAAWLLASLDCLFSGLSLNLHCCSSLHSTLRDTPHHALCAHCLSLVSLPPTRPLSYPPPSLGS